MAFSAFGKRTRQASKNSLLVSNELVVAEIAVISWVITDETVDSEAISRSRAAISWSSFRRCVRSMASSICCRSRFRVTKESIEFDMSRSSTMEKKH